MGERDAYITSGEFDRWSRLILERIDAGFRANQQAIAETADLQRETNGRLRKAETTIAVLSKARLIDRVEDLEQARAADVATDAAAAKAAGRRDRVTITVISGAVSVLVALLVAGFKKAMGW